MHNVVVEGIDRAGKSTLVRELKNALGWDARFLGHRPGEQYLRYLRGYATTDRMVIERGHVSEAVYSYLFGRPEPFEPAQLRVLDGVLATTAIVVFADPDLDDVAARYEQRTLRQTVTPEQIAAGASAFRAWFDTHDYPGLIRYHSTDFDEMRGVIDLVVERVGA